MGLPFGCTTKADEAFTKKWNLHTCTKADNNMLLRGDWMNSAFIYLSPVYGDCTACTLYSEYLLPDVVNTVFKMIQEYMSMNARISCFFSKKIDKNNIQTWLNEIQKFHVTGLHLQKSNREPDSNMYMLSGILKVTTPCINTYDQCNTKHPSNYNYSDVTEFNKINSQFKLQTL